MQIYRAEKKSTHIVVEMAINKKKRNEYRSFEDGTQQSRTVSNGRTSKSKTLHWIVNSERLRC